MNPTVTLRLNADNSRLVPVVRSSEAEVKRLGGTSAAAGQQAQRGASGITALGNAADTTGHKATAMGAAMTAARTAVGAFAGVQAVGALVSLSDQYANITGRLKLATDGQKSYAAASAEVFAISQRTSTAMESTAALYSRMAQSTAEYGVTQQRQLALTESINKTFAISGASATAAANTITQLTQALAGGVLRAEEYNSVVENSARLAQAIADGMGVGMGELRKQVNDGQVTVEKLIQALESQASRIDSEFSQIPLTVERSMVQLKNSIMKYVGESSQELGAGSAIAESVAFLARNLQEVDQVVSVLAIAFGSRLVANLVKATGEKIAAAAASRALAREELVVAQAAERQAAGRVSLARAGISAAGGLSAAEQALAAAQTRTAAAAQASSIALTAKASAMRGLNAAMGAFGGPVGLAITALTLFVAWAMNSRQKAEELSKAVTAGFQPATKTLEDFNAATANTKFADLPSVVQTIKDAQKEVEALRARYAELAQTQNAWLARAGSLPAGFNKQLDEAAGSLSTASNRLAILTQGYDQAIDTSTDLILSSAGVTNATRAQRDAVEALAKRQADQGATIKQSLPLFQELVGKLFDAEAAARLGAAAFDKVGAASKSAAVDIKAALASISEGLDKQIATLELQLIEKTQGKAARMRAEFIANAARQGLDPTSKEYTAQRARNEQAIALTEALERQAEATQLATKAQSDSNRAAEEAKRAREQQIQSQAKYTAEASKAAAELRGPLAVAEEEHRQRIVELDRELSKHLITRQAYDALVSASARNLAQQTAELTKQQQAPAALLASMGQEVQLLGMAGTARERYTRQLRSQQDMVDAINDANKAGAGINAGVTQTLLAQARAWADASLQVETHAAQLEEWADVGTRGAADVSDLLADTFSNSLNESESFFDRLKDVFRNGWRDVLRTLLEQSLVRPIQTGLQNLLSGALNGAAAGAGGGWMSSLAGLIGGGRGLTASGASAANSGWSTAMAGAGSVMGFGNTVGLLTSSAGAAANGGADLGTLVNVGGTLYKMMPSGGISGGMVAGASYLAGGLGALYGFKQGGDTAGKALGAGAYGVAGYYGATALGTVASGAAAAGASGAAAAGSAALGAIPVAGWVALAAIAVDKVTGGGLFGTKFKTNQTSQTFAIGADGAAVTAEAEQSRKKSLFRGTKRRTVSIEASEESISAANEIYEQVQSYARQASEALGLATVEIISGSFRQVYDAKGNLKSELSTVLGRTFNETAEDFQQRLAAENIVAQIDQLDGTASAVAERWRSSAANLFEGAQFLLSAASDFNTGSGLLTQGGLSRLTDLVETLRHSGETLDQAYQRVSTNARSYGSTAAEAYQEVATAGFSSFASSLLQIRQQEKQRIESLQAQAKALGGLSAREQDLSKVREAATLQADSLARSLETELVGLALNRINDQIEQLGGAADGAGSKVEDFLNSLRLSDTLSPETDIQKRGGAADLMATAASAGNIDSFTQYAQQFLEVSRRLNASGAGYQADYAQVLELSKRLGSDGTASSLQQLYDQQAALQAQQETAARLERAQRIAQGVADLAGARGGDPLEMLREVTGISAEALAQDLGLTVDQLSKYLADQQTDITDLADILYDLPTRIAQEMVAVLADAKAPSAGTSAGATAGAGGNPAPQTNLSAGRPDDQILEQLVRVSDGIQTLVKHNQNVLLQTL